MARADLTRRPRPGATHYSHAMPRTYAITGAASGIGAATAELFRDRGDHVITVDRHNADVVADLATPAGRAKAVAGVRARTDVLHGVVPCAGVAGGTDGDGALVASLNYFGSIDVVTGLRPLLSAGHAAGVVLISSNSVECQPGWPHELATLIAVQGEASVRRAATQADAVHVYPASKLALRHWMRRHVASWGADDIRINAIAPGLVETAMAVSIRADPELGSFVDAYPSVVGRPGRPEEVAEVIAWLLSEESALVVGTTVVVDGGTDAVLNPRRSN